MKNNLTQAEPLVSVRKLAIMIGEDPDKLRELGRQAANYYQPFDKTKLSTKKVRHIDNPVGELKKVQVKINKIIFGPIHTNLPAGVIGGVRGKSNITNAAEHTGQELVLALDIRKCYPSTGNYDVKQALQRELGFGNDISDLLMQLTTYNGHLPQGAPTSPILCNLVLLPLFRHVLALVEPFGLELTMYVDDITVSGKAVEVRNVTGGAISAIQKYGYRISSKKTKLMSAGKVQMVTGVVVNNGVGAQREIIESLRREILSIAQQPAIERAKEAPRLLGKLRYYAKISSRAKRALNLYHTIEEDKARQQR